MSTKMHYDLQPYDRPGPLESGPAPSGQPTVRDTLRVLRRRGWVVGVILACALGAALFITQRTPKTWRSHAQLILQTHPAGQTGPAPVDETVETQLTMLQNHEMAQRTVTLLRNRLVLQGKPADSLGIDAPTLERDISAGSSPGTNIIDLYVDSDSPERAALLGDGVAAAFIAWKREIAQHNSEDSLRILTRRADRAGAALDKAERQQLVFNKGKGIVDPTSQSSALLGQSQAADQSVLVLTQDLSAKQASLNALSTQLQGADARIRSGRPLRDDSETIRLQEKLTQLKNDRAAAARRVTRDFPGSPLNDFDNQIQATEAQLRSAVSGALDKDPTLQAQGDLANNYKQAQVAVTIAESSLASARQQQATLKSRVTELPDRNLQSARLGRAVTLASNLYASLQTNLSQARAERDNAAGNVLLVQPADVPDAPVAPNRTRNLLVGGGVGLALAVLAVMLLEQMDRRVRDTDHLRRIGGQDPIAGSLPQMSRRELSDLRRGDLSPATAEALNLAAINLGLLMRESARRLPAPDDVEKTALYPRWAANGAALGPDLPSLQNRVVLVTSALPGEGKSVTAAALARAMARGGKRVILVDADLRRPTQGQMFPADAPEGLADVLAGRLPLVDALQPTEVPNLLVLHAGQVSDSPTGLLSRPRLTELMRELRGADCTVLIDTPACAVVSDAYLLAPHADCVLHVVGLGLIDESVIQQTRAALSAAGPQAMAYFINRAPNAPGHAYQGYYAAPVVVPEDLEPVEGQAAPAAHSTRPVTSLWKDEA